MNRSEHPDEPPAAGQQPAAEPATADQPDGDENRNPGEFNGLPTSRSVEPGSA